jgi:hypothetical protein
MQIVRDNKVVLSRVVGVAIVLIVIGFMFRTLYLDWEQIVTYRWNLNYVSFVAWVVGFLSLVTPSSLGGDGGHPGLIAELILPGTCGDHCGPADQGDQDSQRSGLCAAIAWRL